MPHYTTWGGTYVTRPVAREDRSPIQSDGDFNDVVFHSKQADGFMKLGDIKGEIVRSDGDEIINNGGGHKNLNGVTWREDGAGRFTTGGGGDSIINTTTNSCSSEPLPLTGKNGKVIIDPYYQPEADGYMKLGDIRGEHVYQNRNGHLTQNFKGSTFTLSKPSDALAGDVDRDSDFGSWQDVRDHKRGNRSNWDVIFDLETAIKQTSVADALTNAGQKGFTWEAAADYWTNGGASIFNADALVQQVNGTIGYEMQPAHVANTNNQMCLETGLPVEGIGLRSDNRFVFEPLNAMTSFGDSFDPGLDGANGFKPREVAAVEIGRPPEPKFWLQMLG